MTVIDISPARAVHQLAQSAPNRLAIRYEGGDLTISEVDERAARLAAVLLARGVAPGDRVSYLGMNSPAFVVTLLAATRIGASFVPLNFRLAAVEVTTILASCEAAVIICEEGHRALIDEVAAESKLSSFLLIDDDPAIPAGPLDDRWIGLSGEMAIVDPSLSLVPRTFDDLAILMYTSGTTGLPKGVLLTHGNIWWNSFNVDSVVDTHRTDVTLASAPLFHVGALNSFALRTLVRGGTVIIRRHFDPEQMARDLAEFKVNTLFAVPAMFSAVARVPGFFDRQYPDLRGAIVAGAPVPPRLIEQYLDRGIVLQQAWGLTETAPFATHLPAELTREKLGSAGIAMPYTEVAILNVDSGEPITEPGSRGEIIVRGPNVTPGYWDNPDATAAAFDDEGFFHSGDIGYLDEDGFLYIVDRLKDMIITGGENVYPAEVEGALSDMPGVLDVAVVGTPDNKWGESVVVVVSVASGTSITIDDIRAYGEQRLARYKLPRELVIVEALPRNASGKLDKKKVRTLATPNEKSSS